MKATAIRSFMRDGVLVNAGETFECDKWEHAKWSSMGFVQRYETKTATPKAETKSAPAAPKKKTATKKKAAAKKK